ncbi:MAG: T9SS C-terminal target domain-containing protein [Bacteroidetes bacterium]|nr:MAG: T9SS C-terminal target domain-containing protein [Bacteroidota bacterium]
MKKLFTLLFAFCVWSLSAQTYFSEDFESGTLPTGWVQMSNATDGGWIVGNNAALSSGYFPVPANGSAYMIGTNDDNCNCDKSNERLAAPPVDLTDASAPFLYFDMFFGGFAYQGAQETMTIMASTDGGASWTTVTDVEGSNAGWVNTAVNLADFVGMSDVTFAWVYDDGGGWLYGFVMDNVVIKEAPQLDPELRSLTMRSGGLTGQSISISGTIFNNGLQVVNSVEVNWNDGTGDHVEAIDGLNIAPLTSVGFAHSVPFTIPQGTSTIAVSISNPNGMTDENEDNNTLTTEVLGVTPAPNRQVVIEEGTGTWCGWCPRGAIFMEQMIENYPDHFIGIAVHNGDPMTVAEYDGGLGFGAFPNMANERTENFGFGTIADIEERFFNRVQMAPPAKIQSAATYDAATGLLTVTSEAVALADVSGDYRLAVILTEDGVTGTNSGFNQANYYAGGGNGPMGGYESLPDPVPAAQMVYDHVGRVLVGGFNGVAGSLPSDLVTGERYTWVFDPVTIPADYNIDNMHLVTVLLNPQGEIVNAYSQTSAAAFGNTIVGTKEVFAHDLAKVFPNPFSDVTNVRLTLEKSTNVEMVVLNALGQVVAQRAYGELSGDIMLPFDGSNMAEGMYYLHIRLDGQLITKKVTLAR